MKHKRHSLIRRIAAMVLAAALTAGIFTVCAIDAEAAAPGKPGDCHFEKWMNSDYTQCHIKWKKVSGADGYETCWSWTDGSHKKTETWKGQHTGIVYNVPNNRVSIFKIRAYKKSGSKKTYGAWSNTVYITPSPTSVSWKWAYQNRVPVEKFEWKRVYGTSGYRIYLATDPNGTWTRAATVTGSASLKATIKKYKGSAFKAGTAGQYKYYFRIVSIRKSNGKYVEAPLYRKGWWQGYFYFTKAK